MRSDRLRFAEPVLNEWRALTPSDRDALRVVLEKIDDDPIAGVPLYAPLQGLWSYRSGALRVVYRIAPEAKIVVILHLGRTQERAA